MKWLDFLFNSNKDNPKPLVLVDIQNTMVGHFSGLNVPLYHALAEFKQQGAELCLATDGNPGLAETLKYRIEDEGLDPDIFTHVLSPSTNDGLTKTSEKFWPAVMKKFKRSAGNILLLDDDDYNLRNADRNNITHVLIPGAPSSDEVIADVKRAYKALVA